MAGDTSTLLLSSDESGCALAVLREAAGACSFLPLSQFLSNPEHCSSPKERILLSLATADREAAAAASAKFLSSLQADGVLIAVVEGSDGLEVGKHFTGALPACIRD